MEFLRIKETGRCEIELPEFDLDYPGQYMRRIKNVTLTIPCVTGPYNGVHCRATLLSSVTRIDPRLEVPATRCCCVIAGASARGSPIAACWNSLAVIIIKMIAIETIVQRECRVCERRGGRISITDCSRRRSVRSENARRVRRSSSDSHDTGTVESVYLLCRYKR